MAVKFNIPKKSQSTSALSQLLESRRKDEEERTYDPGEQAEGLKTRLEGSGLEHESFTDDRNFLGKMLNLTPNQNFLFDVFEIIERPQQAVFQGIKAIQDDENVFDGMWQGLSGKGEEVYFQEILREAGVGHEDTFGVDDVLGFVGDVFLDPIDVALIAAAPFSGGATAAVAFADKSLDTMDGMRKSIDILEADIKSGKGISANVIKTLEKKKSALKALEKKAPAFKELKKQAKNLLDITEKGTDVEKVMAKKQYKEALKPLLKKKTPLEMAFRGTKFTGSKILKTADDHIVKFLESVDAKKMVEMREAGEVVDATSAIFKLQRYTNFKDQAKSIFSASTALPKEWIRKTVGRGDIVKERVMIHGEEANKVFDEFVKTVQKTEPNISEAEIAERIQKVIEFKMMDEKISVNALLGERFKQLDETSKDALTKHLKENVLVYDETGKNLKRVYSDEMIESMFIEGTLADDVGTKYYTIDPGMREDIIKQSELSLIDQDDYYKISETQKKIKEAQKAKRIADNVDATTYRLDPDTKNLVWSKTNYSTQTRAMRLIDDDIISKNLDELGNFDSNEKIRRASRQQRTRLNKKLKSIKDPEEVKRIEEQISELTGIIKYTDNNVRKMKRKLKPYMNPDDYKEEIIKQRNGWPEEEVTPDQRYAGNNLEKPNFLTGKEKDQIKEWMDGDYGPVAEQIDGHMKRMYEELDGIMGTNFKTRGTDGYIRHTLTPEAKEMFEKGVMKNVDKSYIKGRTSAFNYREYNMSAQEANKFFKTNIKEALETLPEDQAKELSKYVDAKMFTEEATKSISDFMKESVDISKASKMFDELAMIDAFSNPELFNPVKGSIKKGFRQRSISRKDLMKKLGKIKDYRKDGKAIDSVIDMLATKYKDVQSFYLDNNVADLIGLAGNPEPAGFFLSMIEGINTLFKKLSLATPGFHVRNAVGNYTNLYLSGIDMNVYNGYLRNAQKTISDGTNIYKKGIKNGFEKLTSDEKLIFKEYEDFISSGFHDIAYELYDLPSLAKSKLSGKASKKENLVNTFFRKNMDANKYMDNMYRMALLEYAKDNPESYLKLGVQSPSDFVRLVLFDPNDLTLTEKKWLRSTMPFYTFMKKNLVYQMRNVVDNPNRYNKVAKMVEGAWTMQGLNQDDVEMYKKENFWIPVFKKENGEYIALKANLPIGDLGEFVSNPMQKVLSSITPAVRAPFELVTNTQTYTGLPIQQFKGQRGYRLPFLNRKTEYLVGQTGALNPIAVGAGLFSGPKEDQSIAENVFNAMSITSTGSIEREKSNRAYQELEQLREAVSYYKQEGKDVLTMDEISEIVSLDKSRTSQILNRLKSNIK